jgi:putative aminopeptidase FrvX
MKVRVYLTLIILSLILLSPQKTYSAQIPDFSGENAYDQIKYLVQKIGPRPAGSKAEQEAAKYIKLTLEEYGWKVKEQPFSKIVVHETPLSPGEQKIELVNSQNIIADLPGSNQNCILMGAHYDSAGVSVPGAVDNASGVGLLLELARVLAFGSHQETYQIVFFGAEESGLVGSSYYANQADLSAINWMLNLDMIGLPLEIDVAAKKSAPPELIKKVTDLTRKSEIPFHLSRDFIVMTRESSHGGTSDFSSFLDKGIPALGLGIAGRPAGFFHRPEDGMEQISLKDLQKVGDYVKLLVTSVKLEQKGLQSWDELYLTFQLGSRIIILPSFIIGLYILLTISFTIIIFLKSYPQKCGFSCLEYFKVIGVVLIAAFLIVSITETGELLWRTVKNMRVIWYAYPGYFLLARIGIAFCSIILLGSLLQRLSLPRDPLIYWRIGVLSLVIISSITALIRIDLAFPFVFWLSCYNLQLLFPNIMLTALGPYFFYKLHWELLYSLQWFSFYETVHQYFWLFMIIYALLIIPLILGIFQICYTKIKMCRKYLILLYYPAVATLIIIILGLGLVPCYTSKYAQTVTVQEEWLANSKGRLHIFSNDNLPSGLLGNFNVQGQKEIYLQGFNDVSPVDMKVTVTERYLSGRLLDLYFNHNYLFEPFLLRISIKSQEPFQVTQTEGFLPFAKLPKSILLKGKKFGDDYSLTMESTPPYNKTFYLSIEANGQIKCKIESLLAYNSDKFILKEDNLSVNYQTMVRGTYDF